MDVAVSSMQAGGPPACSPLYPWQQHGAQHIVGAQSGVTLSDPAWSLCGWMPRNAAGSLSGRYATSLFLLV